MSPMQFSPSNWPNLVISCTPMSETKLQDSLQVLSILFRTLHTVSFPLILTWTLSLSSVSDSIHSPHSHSATGFVPVLRFESQCVTGHRLLLLLHETSPLSVVPEVCGTADACVVVLLLFSPSTAEVARLLQQTFVFMWSCLCFSLYPLFSRQESNK